MLISADGSVFDIATGDRLRSPQGSSQFTGSVGKFAAHPNGRYVFFVTYFTGANPFARHSIGYTSLSSSPFTLATGYQIPANSSAAGGGHAVCLSGDGSLAFSAGSSRMEIHDSQTLALRASLPLNSGGTNAACASSGLLAATGSGPAFDGRNLWVLRPDGSILVNESLMPDPDNFDPQVEGLAVSSDATRIVATDAGTKLLFRGLPAP